MKTSTRVAGARPSGARLGLLVLVLLVLAAVAAVVLRPASAPPERSSDEVAGPPTSIPDTAYEIPDGAVFLATTGDDEAAGDEAAPVRTLQRAIDRVPDGGTVVVRGGTYRDGSSDSIDKTFTLQAYPHEQAWFDGADVTTGWVEGEDGTWVLEDWSTPDFCAGDYYDEPWADQREDNRGPCTHVDMGGHDANPAAGDPQMLFLDGVPVREVVSQDDVEADSFFYDQQARRVVLGTDPRGRLVEMSARPMALRLEGGEGESAVKGLGFRRYATNEYNANATHGAVLSNDSDNLFENNAFTQMAGAGLSLADPRRAVVRGNRFVRNGFNGLDANGSSTEDRKDDLLVEDNLFDGNNAELFGKGCRASCAAAGSKLAHMNGLTVRGNVFANTAEGAGLWCDLDCSRAVITGNVFRDNDAAGLYYEVSSRGVIADNLMVGNGDYGLKSGSARMWIYHNTLVDNGTNVLIYDDDRSPGVDGWDDVGPDTVDNDFSNNVLSGGEPSFSAWRTSSKGDNTGPGEFMRRMDHNTYHRRAADDQVLIDWRGGSRTGYETLEDFQRARDREKNGQDLTGEQDPFVDRAAGDYGIRADSDAATQGRPLPDEVAEALGLEAGSRHGRGALTTTRSRVRDAG